MTGIIDTGGGLRGIYGAGVFDYCLDNKISFSHCVGISAGSANVASFLGNQKGRNYLFYCDYAFRKEYMSLKNYISKGSYIDLNYVYGVLSNNDGENPLNFDSIKSFDGQYTVVATNARTGTAHYFTKEDMRKNDYRILAASSSIPAIGKPYVIEGTAYYDGGIADPIPIDFLLESGCEKAVVILTRPKAPKEKSKLDPKAALLIKAKYPKTADVLMRRYEIYNSQLQKIMKLEKEGRCLIIAPDDTCGLETLTKDKAKLDMLYKKGYSDAQKIKEFI